MAYTWAFSAGIKRELTNNMAVSIDYVGNRGKRQHRRSSTSTKARSIRPRAGSPGSAWTSSTRRESSFRQRLATRRSSSSTRSRRRSWARRSIRISTRSSWSSKSACRNRGPDASAIRSLAATTSRAIIVDSNPRLDYGRCDRDNTHAFADERELRIWQGLWRRFRVPRLLGLPDQRDEWVPTPTATARRITTGRSRASTIRRRCRQGFRTIVSALDSRGVAIRNGIDGEKKTILDGTVPVHPQDRSLPGGAVPRDLQPHQSRQLRQSDRRTELGQLPDDNRGRQSAHGADRIPCDVLI